MIMRPDFFCLFHIWDGDLWFTKASVWFTSKPHFQHNHGRTVPPHWNEPDKLSARCSHESENYSMQSPVFSCHSELNQSTPSVVFYSPLNCVLWCQEPTSHPIMCVMSRHPAPLTPLCRLLLRCCIFTFIIYCTLVTTAVFPHFYSTNWSQSPFNGISINLLNGFKNSFSLMWVFKKILMWTLKVCSRRAQFDRISSVSARLGPDS